MFLEGMLCKWFKQIGKERILQNAAFAPGEETVKSVPGGQVQSKPRKLNSVV